MRKVDQVETLFHSLAWNSINQVNGLVLVGGDQGDLMVLRNEVKT